MKQYADTTLKRMTKGELIEIIRCFENNVKALEEMNANQFKILMEKEMYAWHDLRKNPQDLPDESHLVLGFDGSEYGVAIFYRRGVYHGWATSGQDVEPSDIIAWRCIEPFEEGNE